MAKEQIIETGLASFYLPIWFGEDTNPPKANDCGDLQLAIQEVFTADFNAKVRLRVSREGYFLFDFSQHATAKPRESERPELALQLRARFMNLFLACLLTELSHEKKAPPHLFIDHTTIMSPREWTLDPHAAVSESATHQRVGDERKRLFLRQTFSVERIEAAVSATDTATRAADDRDVLAEMILHAFDLYLSGRMESSLVTAWTVVERCLNEIWGQYVERQHSLGITKVNVDRRKRLRGSDFTASIVAEALSLSGELSHDDYERLSIIRKKRNDWVHKLAQIDLADAASAIVLAQSMLRAAKLLNLKVPFFPIRTYPLSYVAVPQSTETIRSKDV